MEERDFAFTQEEAEELFAYHGLRLNAGDMDHVLRSRTAGRPGCAWRRWRWRVSPPNP